MKFIITVQPGQDWCEACDPLVNKACAFLSKEDEQFFDHVGWLKALLARGELVLEYP